MNELTVLVKVINSHQREKVLDAFPFTAKTYVDGNAVYAMFRMNYFEFAEMQAARRELTSLISNLQNMLTKDGKFFMVRADTCMGTVLWTEATRRQCDHEESSMQGLSEKKLYHQLREKE